MIEEISEYGNLKRLEHKLLCTSCRIEMQMGELESIFLTYPPQYVYVCPQCGNKITTKLSYPYTEIVGDPICTYQQETD